MLPIFGADGSSAPKATKGEPTGFELACPQFVWSGSDDPPAVTTVNQPCGTADLFGIWSWYPFLAFLSVYAFVFGSDIIGIYDQMFVPQHWAFTDEH